MIETDGRIYERDGARKEDAERSTRDRVYITKDITV
jgi:hypothetical protein